jgi:isopenicillin N synthase-like dioxygenase
MSRGYKISSIIFRVLEKALKLPDGALTSLHRLEDDSSDFVRLLRYPGYDSLKHKD